jgi:hypothetical protein
VSAKFELIDAQKADFPIVKMCEWAEVSCGVPELGHQCCPGLLGGCFVFVDQAAEDGSARDPFR